MRLRNWRTPIVAVLAAVAGGSAGAQGVRPQEPDVLSALLTEVRGLRAAMEVMASTGPRVQLSLGRLQLQEQRVNTIIRRLDSVRDTVGAAEREVLKEKTDVDRAAAWVKDPPQGEAEDVIEMRTRELNELKRRLASGVADLQRLQSEEAVLQQQIAAEQGRWNDINRALEDLERTLRKQ
jgi:chromosome segregation ATPase